MFDAVVLDGNGRVDRVSNVDYLIGTEDDDIYFGGDEDNVFNALWSGSADGDAFEGGAGDDTLVIEDSIANRGLFGSLSDQINGVGNGNVDLDSVEISARDDLTNAYQVIGVDLDTEDTNGDIFQINTTVRDVDRIDLREYVDDTSLYVVDSYELLEGVRVI